MEVYQIYLQQPVNIRIVIEVSLMVLVVIWFFLQFEVVITNRRLAKLLESVKQVEGDTHRGIMTLKKLSWDLAKFGSDDEVASEEAEFEDEDRTPTCITCQKCYHMNDIGAQICTRCCSWL